MAKLILNESPTITEAETMFGTSAKKYGYTRNKIRPWIFNHPSGHQLVSRSTGYMIKGPHGKIVASSFSNKTIHKHLGNIHKDDK
jgi:hypothetical protein